MVSLKPDIDLVGVLQRSIDSMKHKRQERVFTLVFCNFVVFPCLNQNKYHIVVLAYLSSSFTIN